MKVQIEIDQLHPIPENHVVLTPVGTGSDTKWLDLRADDRYQFNLADCGDETLLHCIRPNGSSFIDTKSKIVEKMNCPRCNHPMRPKVYPDGWLDQTEFVCDCDMTVTREYS